MLWYVKWSYNSPLTDNLESVCDTAAITNGVGGGGVNQGKSNTLKKPAHNLKSASTAGTQKEANHISLKVYSLIDVLQKDF